MKTTGTSFILCALLLTATAPLWAAEEPAPTTAGAVFDKLKAMEGTWKAEADGEEGTMESVFEYRVSANGTVVMETMHPGTGHEMINMYHLDGEDLVLTHYCASGNQPTMKLDRSTATDTTLPFEFTGGTNLDPAADTHIHNASIVFAADDRVESSWVGWTGGKEAGVMTFTLSRSE